MCITDDNELNEKMRILRDHGMSKERKYYHEVVGYNYRMTNLQAAIGTAQLERINEILEWRGKLEEQYREFFKGIQNVVMQKNDLIHRKKIAWLVSILVDMNKRDFILQKLKEEGVDARAFFTPLSEMGIYQKYARNCIKSKKISKMGLNLPTTYGINKAEIEKIKNIVDVSLN